MYFCWRNHHGVKLQHIFIYFYRIYSMLSDLTFIMSLNQNYLQRVRLHHFLSIIYYNELDESFRVECSLFRKYNFSSISAWSKMKAMKQILKWFCKMECAIPTFKTALIFKILQILLIFDSLSNDQMLNKSIARSITKNP